MIGPSGLVVTTAILVLCSADGISNRVPVGIRIAHADASETKAGDDQSPKDDTTRTQGHVAPLAPLISIFAEKATVNDSTLHFAGIGSNVPSEDFVDAAVSRGPRELQVYAIYDGHAGGYTARALQALLTTGVITYLLADDSPVGPLNAVQRIKKAFLDMDAHFMDKAKCFVNGTVSPYPNPDYLADWKWDPILPAISGSCALMAILDVSKSRLYVANVGDSRCVLGRYDPALGCYTARALSNDHTGFNSAEVTRIEREHPGEKDIVDPETGRIFGLAVLRAFGDARWKWDDETVMAAHKKRWGPLPRPGGVIKTPPYLTAEPEVTETQIRTGGNGDFIILASDGLWDHMTNDQAVHCVQEWLRRKASGRFPIQEPDIEEGDMYYDDRPGHGLTWKTKTEYFSYDLDNAAACLIKSALGGRRRWLFELVTSSPPPISREVRDDTTVQVVFFGDVEGARRQPPAKEDAVIDHGPVA